MTGKVKNISVQSAQVDTDLLEIIFHALQITALKYLIVEFVQIQHVKHVKLDTSNLILLI